MYRLSRRSIFLCVCTRVAVLHVTREKVRHGVVPPHRVMYLSPPTVYTSPYENGEIPDSLPTRTDMHSHSLSLSLVSLPKAEKEVKKKERHKKEKGSKGVNVVGENIEGDVAGKFTSPPPPAAYPHRCRSGRPTLDIFHPLQLPVQIFGDAGSSCARWQNCRHHFLSENIFGPRNIRRDRRASKPVEKGKS